MVNILILEDDLKLNEAMYKFLSLRGYNVFRSYSASEAYDVLYENDISLIISDLMLEGINGFEFIEDVRNVDNTISIIIVSALSDISSLKKGFRIGADDYMSKPINFDELAIRIEALLRRRNISIVKRVEVDNLVLDENEYNCLIDGKDIDLTLREFQILFLLLTNLKKTYTRSQILEKFNDVDSLSTLRSVDVAIVHLRKKIEGLSNIRIETVRGVGYKAVVYEEK